MNKLFIKTGSIIGLLSVSLGAFGAHALKDVLLASNRVDTYETAIKYMFYHALALILVAILQKEFITVNAIKRAGWFFIAGIVIFSGSLLLLCATGLTFLGAITPIGGVAFIVGWVLLFVGVSKK